MPAKAKAEPGRSSLQRAAPHQAAKHVPSPPWAQRAPGGTGAGPSLRGRTGLPDRLRAGVEALSGLAMDDVRVHRNSPEPARLGALAYTSGSDIHLAPGQEAHLPHEAWHVVQQKQGRVEATAQLRGVALNDSSALEAEADAMGARALRETSTAAESSTTPSSPRKRVVQRAAHRADVGQRVRYLGHVWTVTQSGINNPNIQLQRPPNHNVTIAWAGANYTILRANNANDNDMRVNDLEAGVDAYAALSQFDRDQLIRTKFSEARAQALQMIKDLVSPQVNQASRPSLNNLALTDFTVTRQGPTLVGAGKATEAAEWEYTWVEGQANNPRRTWTFVIDSDNPLATSSQEPHVGWTVRAAAGTQGAVGNTFGHVWLDYVPVMR